MVRKRKAIKGDLPGRLPPDATVSIEAEATSPPSPSKPTKWEGLSDEKKLETALRHFGIKRRDVLSYRVYPHKVAIVHGFGQKVEYWPA